MAKFKTQGFIVGKEKTKASPARKDKDGKDIDARPESYNIAVVFGLEVKENAGVFFLGDIPSIIRVTVPKNEYMKVTKETAVNLTVEQTKAFMNVLAIEGFTVIDWRDPNPKSANEDEEEDEDE